MANTYNYLKSVFQELQQENKNHSSLLYILLVLLTIPLSYAINSISLGLLLIVTAITFRRSNFKIDIYLCFPILLYVLMALSVIWSIDRPSSTASLVKELPLLLIPICFLLFKELSPEQKKQVIKFYSYGIFLFVIFYFAKALIRFAITNDSSVFFYHELVTKDVNAIHVSVYVAMAFFYFFTKASKSVIDFIAIGLLLIMVFLLSSKNIIVVFIGLMICYHLFYSKMSKKMRLKNLIIFLVFLFSLTFVGKIKERFKQEYETMMTDSSVNDVVNKSGPVYNVSIKQAWTNTTFQPNDYFPGTAFRIYQMRIFLEMLQEDGIFFTGYGLNSSYPKIAAKGVQYNLFLGDANQEGYQTKNFHNQYIQNFAELGIFGLAIILTMLFINMKNALKTKDFIHISFAVLMISLFLTESFLWRQRGVMFFTAMYCLFNSGFVTIAPKKE